MPQIFWCSHVSPILNLLSISVLFQPPTFSQFPQCRFQNSGLNDRIHGLPRQLQVVPLVEVVALVFVLSTHQWLRDNLFWLMLVKYFNIIYYFFWISTCVFKKSRTQRKVRKWQNCCVSLHPLLPLLCVLLDLLHKLLHHCGVSDARLRQLSQFKSV